jgi:hypothetical protein
MKKSEHFAWTLEAQDMLDSRKNLLKSPSVHIVPALEEPMLLYITAMTQVVSATLVIEQEEPRKALKVQHA